MAKLTGTSDWRAFTLPFNATAASSRPSKLVVNVQLPGKGSVFLRNLKLVQSTGFDGAATQTGGRWSDRTVGVVGGVGGALIGCLGALIEWLAARGKAQRFVVNAVRVLIGAGVVFALGGLAAVRAAAAVRSVVCVPAARRAGGCDLPVSSPPLSGSLPRI